MIGDLSNSFADLRKQADAYESNLSYYEGTQPLKYSNERLKDVFERSGVRFVENWCSVVVNSVLDRMIFKGWDNENETINNSIDEFYKKNKLQFLSRRVHRDVLVSGNGYLMLDNIEGEVKAFYNSPENVIVSYDEETGNMSYGMKMWFNESANKSYVNLYYATTIERYSAEGMATRPNVYSLDEIVPNIFGRIPIIHFRIDENELDNIVTIQDAINKFFSDMMVVGEFAAFPQRWIITNADINDLRAAPHSLMKIPKGVSGEEGTSLGEFGTANLQVYLTAMDRLSSVIGIISRTPKHYFMNTGANLAGESLIVMESVLVKKVKQRIESMDDGWIELAKFLYSDNDFVTIWDRVDTELLITMVQAMQAYKALGIPLLTVLRRFGWDNSEIDQMLADKEQEDSANATIASMAIEQATRRFERTEANQMPDIEPGVADEEAIIQQ